MSSAVVFILIACQNAAVLHAFDLAVHGNMFSLWLKMKNKNRVKHSGKKGDVKKVNIFSLP